ncbi:CRAL-TRIO domain-containing protein, partial [Paraphysoderma sedebokerense]
RANTFNLTNAYTQLSNTVQWRRTFQPERITPDMIVKESVTGKIHINGFDNEGHPILILRDRHENSKDSKTQVMFLVFMLELTIKIMPSHIEKLILVIDKKGSSLRSTPSLSMVKEVLHILMNHYPERLHKAFLVDVPWLFWATYKIISPFIHPVTKRKIFLVTELPTTHANMVDHIPFERLDVVFGGGLEWEWCHKDYWQEVETVWKEVYN